jgi:3',5'-cyclic AMP phosphodiesterase CpdA
MRSAKQIFVGRRDQLAQHKLRCHLHYPEEGVQDHIEEDWDRKFVEEEGEDDDASYDSYVVVVVVVDASLDE